MNAHLLRALQQGKPLDAAILEAAAPMREAIRQMLQQKPFVPFQFSLTSGSVIEIRTPEWVTLRPAVLEINTPEPGSTEPTWRSTIALEHVVTLTPMIADEPAVVERPKGNVR